MKRRAAPAIVLAAILGAAAWMALPKRLPLPPERPQLGPMKPVASARTSQARLANGQLLLTIDHETIRGATPAMLRWWFEHLGESMVHEGVSYPRYLLWHPRDHIHWELARRAPGGGTGQGAYFRIVEAFAANPAFYVDSTEHVEKLDDEGISLARRILGVEVFRLEHRFGSAAGGRELPLAHVGRRGGRRGGTAVQRSRPSQDVLRRCSSTSCRACMRESERTAFDRLD